MTDDIAATARLTSWSESPTPDDDASLPRLATAEVAFAYDGDLHGTSTCHYVLHYRADGSGEGVGFETITGDLDGAAGSLTVGHRARFDDDDGVTVDLTAVAGTGARAEVSGSGSYQVAHGGQDRPWSVTRRRGRAKMPGWRPTPPRSRSTAGRSSPIAS